MKNCANCIVGCLGFCFCDVLCCECNCLIFPAPQSTYSVLQKSKDNQNLRREYHTFDSSGGDNIPYLEISTQKSRSSKKCFIYFHGNAEDIGSASYFIEPIALATDITFYAIEYPTYGQYHPFCRACISNAIKQDALDFYNYLKRTRNLEDIYVMGRSVGSGGASYLAGHQKISLLILISPFDTIRKTSQDIIGCLGCIVKQHFDNQEALSHFQGNLLVIHGEVDEVISINRARNLVRVFQNKFYKSTATTVYPARMSHNRFSMEKDIVAPIKTFLSDFSPSYNL